MSMHNTPLTDLEREGLEKHLLAIEYPSQLADVFRQGIAWALYKSQSASQAEIEKALEVEREVIADIIQDKIGSTELHPLSNLINAIRARNERTNNDTR